MTIINKPTLLVDVQKCLDNLKRMAEKCRASHVRFRPHFKTHHSIEIGNWFKEFGIHDIAVSSLEMANYFSTNWNNITVAIPVNLREMDQINELAHRIQLNLIVESKEVAKQLSSGLLHAVGIYIKIDTGYGRTGLPSANTGDIEQLLVQIEQLPQFNLKGLLAHPGHTYSSNSDDEILLKGTACINQLNELRARFESKFPNLELSVGDTPFCSVAESFNQVDEVRPGNFIFYDVMQQQIGSNTFDQIAVCLAAPILAIHEDRRSIIVHGGGIHLSKDRIIDSDGKVCFGKVVQINDQGWSSPLEGFKMKSVSQEHGIIEWDSEIEHNFRVGELIGILPIHSCMAANLHGHYMTTSGVRIEKFRID